MNLATMTTCILAVSLGDVYLFLLVAGLAFAVLSAVLAGVGGHGHDIGGHGADAGGADAGGHDVGHDGSHGDTSVHFSPLSPTVIAMFVTAFGAVGLIADSGLGLGAWASLPLATMAGVGVGLGMGYLFARLVVWAQGGSQTSVTEALGSPAEVITPIPAGGLGRVCYSLQGRRFTGSARSTDGQPLAAHTMVVITDVSGPTLTVRQSDEETLKRICEEPT